MRALVHDATDGAPDGGAVGTDRLAALGLTTADFEFVLAGADAEARMWSDLAPPVMGGMARWGKTNELLRIRLLPRGWTCDDPRNLPRTISPGGELAIVAATGDSGTGRPGLTARNLYPRGIETVRAVGRGAQLAFDYPDLPLDDADDLALWLLLYNPAGDEVHAELSRPDSISPSGYVTTWTERIMLPPLRLARPQLRPVAAAAAGVTVPVTRRAVAPEP
jgi:hypothetical protein